MSHSPDVELRLPAESAYVAVLRMTTAGLAARLDFTLDDIEDLRMAVGEACALVLENADAGGDLYANFDLTDGSIRVSVSADSSRDSDPDQDKFRLAGADRAHQRRPDKSGRGRLPRLGLLHCALEHCGVTPCPTHSPAPGLKARPTP